MITPKQRREIEEARRVAGREGAVGPDMRRFDDPERERERQERYARSTLREDGEHWLDGDVCSLEQRDRIRDKNYNQYVYWTHKAGTGVWDFFRMAWASIWHMGMYSEDPYIARVATVHTVGEQIGIQRAMHAQERAADQAREDERMERLARTMARAMFDEADKRRTSG